MATKSEGPVTIKKYANRRLYNTGTSTYVTLEDLATMVKNGEDFAVFDAKSGDDITRSVLTQIIFEQENKEGAQNLLPIKFLRQLIGFYGGAMQKFVPSYLEVSLESFTREQEKFRQQISQAFGATPFGPIMEEQVRRNMDMFKQAFSMFTPFVPRGDEAGAQGEKPATATPAAAGSDLEELRKQLDDMRKKVDKLSDGEK
jgi:polyhydroxyalkanoate synthesis repressor PhaR